ncbi:MAG: type IV secretory system conjugative DNA transfer family protein, partial [Rhodocyclaceae bacterium]|nr:type IV secretory system conjugative DNA transfer family protein [Rhodocyclaceae bacterium]
AKRSGDDQSVSLRALVATIMAPDAHSEAFWMTSSESLITSALSLILETRPPEQHTLSAVFDLLHQPNVVLRLAEELDKHPNLSRTAASGLISFLEMPERETRPSVLASSTQHLRLWDAELVRRLTDTTSFDLQAFIDGAPMSIFIVAPAYRLSAYAPLLRLWLSTLMSALMTRKQVPKHRTLMLCDELGAIGAFDAFVVASTLMRSSGLTLFSFWQNLSQLSIYGAHARTLLDNVAVIQLLGARNKLVAKEFAELANGIDAHEIMELGEDQCVALIEGRRLERMRRVRYFEQPELSVLANTTRGSGIHR